MESMTYEEAIQRLEEVVKQLESGDVPLQKSMELFEEGVALAKFCSKQLDDAEAKVQLLLEKNGEHLREAFELEGEDDR